MSGTEACGLLALLCQFVFNVTVLVRIGELERKR